MDYRLATYVLYLAVSVALTVWVGRTLSRRGRLFLVDVFQQEALADSVNHLLVVGFYLVNFGVVALLITAETSVASAADLIQAVVGKVGVVLLILGGMHFANLFILYLARRPIRQRQRVAAPAAAGHPYPQPYAAAPATQPPQA